jgi:hypothetical protein
MKDQRDKIIKEKGRLIDLENELSMARAAFRQTGCRYRALSPSEMCNHPRHMMKKYPQHVPQPPRCAPGDCPRN